MTGNKTNQPSTKEVSPMSLIKQTLQMQGEHGKAIVETINYMEEMNAKTAQRFEEIERVQRKLEKNISLTRGEQSRLKSAVLLASIYMTNHFFEGNVSEELWNAKRGHTISYIYTVLKNKYDVSTYPEIPHVEFGNAITFVKHLGVDELPRSYYRLTDRMQGIAQKNNDRVIHMHFGESLKQTSIV